MTEHNSTHEQAVGCETTGYASCSDPLYKAAVELAKGQKIITTEIVQCNLLIGYNRAKMLIGAMENRGVVEAIIGDRCIMYNFIRA